VIQQKLMVAAFQCREADAYNRFVIAYRGELQRSDAVLKDFFVRRGGEAGYDSFKTKAANLSALEQARNANTFCADAHALFQTAFANRGSLMSLTESRFVDAGNMCVEPRTVLQAPTKPGNAAKVKMAQAGSASDEDAYDAAPREEDAPPRRYYPARQPGYYGPAVPAYAPPPPRYGWYPRGYYGGW
jgi:hypothetical protein